TQIKADSSGKGIAWHGWCQAGFSAEFSLDGNTLLLGAVGSIAWRGTIISLTEASGTNPPSPVADVTSWFPVGNEDESYV
ncbi:putative integrin alpha-9 isoform X1, partial [Apostichopus japonicus]